MKKMKLRNQFLIVSVAVLAGLALVYFQGIPIMVILVSAVLSLAVVNFIFFLKVKRARETQ